MESRKSHYVYYVKLFMEDLILSVPNKSESVFGLPVFLLKIIRYNM